MGGCILWIQDCRNSLRSITIWNLYIGSRFTASNGTTYVQVWEAITQTSVGEYELGSSCIPDTTVIHSSLGKFYDVMEYYRKHHAKEVWEYNNTK